MCVCVCVRCPVVEDARIVETRRGRHALMSNAPTTTMGRDSALCFPTLTRAAADATMMSDIEASQMGYKDSEQDETGPDGLTQEGPWYAAQPILTRPRALVVVT